jgi:hypothetical protein
MFANSDSDTFGLELSHDTEGVRIPELITERLDTESWTRLQSLQWKYYETPCSFSQ